MDISDFDLFDVDSEGNLSSSIVQNPRVIPKTEPFSSIGILESGNIKSGENGDNDVVVGMDGVEEDYVIKEIDVLFNPSLDDVKTELSLIEFPLRPRWRPYNLDERCRNVRVEPHNGIFEIDLSIDMDCPTYDRQGESFLASKYLLLSAKKGPPFTAYAVGIRKGNQFHLNLLPSVVKFKPSFKHLNSTRMLNWDVSEPSLETQITENWVSLKFHPVKDKLSNAYRQKMLVVENRVIPFQMNPDDYIDSFFPRSSVKKRVSLCSLKEMLLSKPLEERFRFLFMQDPFLYRFSALQHFAPECSTDDALKLISHHAYLVQGLWVSKSSLLFEEHNQVIARDYCLYLFSKSNIISIDRLKSVKIVKFDVLKKLISPFARERHSLDDWKFKEPPDKDFLKNYQHIEEDQINVWSTQEKVLKNALSSKVYHIPSSSNARMTIVSSLGNADHNSEPRNVCLKSIEMVLRKHNVCSLMTISQKLQEIVISQNVLEKRESKTLEFIVSPNHLNILRDAITQVAIEIHNVYVLKSLGNQSLDPFRDLIVNLFCRKEPNAVVTKSEIGSAVKDVLSKRQITTTAFNEVMKELCVSHDGGRSWTLKSGDPKPE